MNFDYAFAWSILPDLCRACWSPSRWWCSAFCSQFCWGCCWQIAQRSQITIVHAAEHRLPELLSQHAVDDPAVCAFFAFPLAGITLPAISTGVIGLGLYYSAYIAEALPGRHRRRAPRAMGSRQGAGFRYASTTWQRIVLPQALKPMLPILGNYLIGMFKETPLLAVITIPELFQAAKQIAGMTYRYNEPYTVMALMFLAISVPTSLLFKYLERRSHV
jgi:polar amino acid transport system permease protein